MKFSKGITAIILMLALLLSSVALADDDEDDDKLKVSGQLRHRLEMDAKDFTGDTDPHTFSFLRTRLNLDFKPAAGVRVFLQPQDSRVLGAANSGNLANDDNLGLHQAFARLNCEKTKGLYLQLGRFEYAKAGHRLLGNVGWHNVGRSWAGALVGLQRGDVNVQVFRLKLEEGDQLANDDKDLIGVYLENKANGYDLFILWDIDNFRNTETNRSDRFTAGGYFARKFEQIDVIANAAYQFGKANFDETDIAAYLVTFEIGYSGQGETPFRIAAGLDMASGDDGDTDNKNEAFNNLYYTGHKFRGYMDYFLASGAAGLNDYMLRGSVTPAKGWKVKGDLHIFQTNQDYTSVEDGSLTKSLGSEIDLSVTKKRQAVTFVAGLSIFMPSEDWKGADADPSLWGYLQTIVGF